MIDRGPEIAAYLTERELDGAGPNVLWAELQQRWPGLTREEGARGAKIAEEILAATLAEDITTREAVDDFLAHRRETGRLEA